MTTGRMSPTCFWVTALNSLQKAIILTPFCPRAGPTGGAGLAWPAGICSLMVATTSFAIVFNVVIQFLNQLSSFNLPIFQLDRSRPAENADRDTQFSAVRINLFHHAALVLEGAVRHLYRLSHLKTNFWLNLVFKLPDLRQHT